MPYLRLCLDIFFIKHLNKTSYLTRFKNHRSGVIGKELVVKGHDKGSLVKGQWSGVTGQGSLVRGHWSGITGRSQWSKVTGHWSNHFLKGPLVRVKGHWTLIRDP